MLETLITYQNAKFEALGYFSKVFGRAELITTAGKYAPFHYIGNGEYVGVSDFDEYGGSTYWRKTGKISVTDISSESLIGGKTLVEVSIPMRLVATIQKSKLSSDDAYTGERLANTLIRTIQSNNVGLKLAIGARLITFNINGWDDDAQAIKKSEYSGRDISPEWVYLAMDIDIVIQASADCLTTECEYYVTDCDVLNKLVSAEQRRDCILPEFDFSTDADFNALSNTQESDLEDRLCAVADDVTITINSAAWSTEAPGSTENIPVKNTAGTALGSKVGLNWEIANITFTDTDAVASSKVAGTNFSATLIPNLTCAQLNQETNGLTLAQRQTIWAVYAARSGQTTSYATGDDGDLENGRGAAFDTLSCNNLFGNTNRFTDELGTQTYTNNLVVDHLTGLMWFRTPSALDTWANAITAANASAQGGFTDWFIPNIKELSDVGNYSLTSIFNYSPLSVTVALWTSTTRASNTAQAWQFLTSGSVTPINKTTTSQYIICRKFLFADI